VEVTGRSVAWIGACYQSGSCRSNWYVDWIYLA